MAKENKAIESPQNETDAATSKIEAIKNLIFGENIVAYDSEFDAVKKDILTKRKELEDLVQDTRKELLQAIDNLSTDVNIRITDLEDTLADNIATLESKKVDKKTLGDLLIAMGEKINQK
ncbi:fructose 1,6-bisphosphatase [Aquimarina intermedia]|uniref:Fructose 1,6-bisphosphatase n=1 Tax=Aquimarina intermedia TaxID=350814 RepID=A0A5S5CA31_9FLAO|nr:fructose 1,6-bisphosphatase [Aquimarina intermedia]TYP76167.1 hypothetical protein BD809_102384 [Aquimarina intermedia]